MLSLSSLIKKPGHRTPKPVFNYEMNSSSFSLPPVIYFREKKAGQTLNIPGSSRDQGTQCWDSGQQKYLIVVMLRGLSPVGRRIKKS